MINNGGSFAGKNVRLIDENGNQLGVVVFEKARNIANEKGLDLVLISDNNNNIVVKCCDYSKVLYEQKKNLKLQKKKNQPKKLKEIKFGINIGENDYHFKLKKINEIVSDGDYCKVIVVLKGREVAHSEFATELINRVIEDSSEFASIKDKVVVEKNNVFVTLEKCK